MCKQFTVSLVVSMSDQQDVLNRIAGLYEKRGYNIGSLAIGETEDPQFSRMTIVSTGDEYIQNQVVKQLNKLHDVKEVVLLDSSKSISMDHLLIKIKTSEDFNAEITTLINAAGGKILDLGDHYLMADITGSTEYINAFISRCMPLGILELCRSGTIALSKGTQVSLSTNKYQQIMGGQTNGKNVL